MKNNIFTKISNIFKKGNSDCRCKNDNKKDAHITEEFERCVMCGDLTSTPVSMPIEWREDYEVGLGQVCINCRKKLRREEEKENKLSHKQILQTIEHSKTK